MEELPDLRAEARLKRYPTIDGSDSHQFMAFKPNSRGFKAAPCLCVCDSCLLSLDPALFSLNISSRPAH